MESNQYRLLKDIIETNNPLVDVTKLEVLITSSLTKEFITEEEYTTLINMLNPPIQEELQGVGE